MAAIEKDVSRNGLGYREVRNRLLKVMALRLRWKMAWDEKNVIDSTLLLQSFTTMPRFVSPPATSVVHLGVLQLLLLPVYLNKDYYILALSRY